MPGIEDPGQQQVGQVRHVGDACTLDECADSLCVNTPIDVAVVCDDSDECTIDSCDPFLGCSSILGDGFDCSTDEDCEAGFTCQVCVCADGQECPADLNFDGDVDAADLADLLLAWGPNPEHPADFDGDGKVGSADLAELLADWGNCPG